MSDDAEQHEPQNVPPPGTPGGDLSDVRGDDDAEAGGGLSYRRFTLTGHAGPLPSPAVLREYEQICPGYAERLLAETERNGQHRRDLDRDELAAMRQVANDRATHGRRGQLCATAVGLGAMTAATLLGVFGGAGGQVVAGIIGTGGLGSLAWAFIRYPSGAAAAAAEAAGDRPADDDDTGT